MPILFQKLQLAAVLLVAIYPLVTTADESILCTASVCDGGSGENNRTLCDWIPATSWPAPDKCNCGNQCVKNLPLEHACTKTQTSFPDILSLCGPGLTCTTDPDDRKKRTCQPYSQKKCVQEALQYTEDQDTGVLGPGKYLPICDDLGDYAPRQCSAASTCYCVDKEGNKIFGEGALTHRNEMNCLCSVYWHDSVILGREAGFKCLANGNFDELQCIDYQYCFCFDPIKEDVTEGPWGFNMMSMLSCYKEEIHGVNYTQPCAEALADFENSLDGDDDLIIIGNSAIPKCNPDGYYSAVQYEGTRAYCSDRVGNKIENFEASLDQAFGMQCACARRRYLMEEGGLGSSKPKCYQNGDFCRVQKRGLLAYCVDGDGNQVGLTKSIDNIANLDCPELPGTIEC